MTIQRVLVAIDFSPCAANVTRRGGEIAASLGASLELLHVVEPPSVGRDTTVLVDTGDGPEPRTAEDYLVTQARARVELYARLLGDVPWVRTAVRVGPVPDTILDEATETHAGLIVMGTHGRTGVARMVFGSVAEEVMRAATVPVLTIRSRWKPSCAASSCQWCVADATEEELRLEAESFG